MRTWIEEPAPPGGTAEPLAAVLHHHTCAWARRHSPNVVLVHFTDLTADLPAELGRLARRLGYDRADDRVRALAAAASIDRMRERAHELAPDANRMLWRDDAAFFRSGDVGGWRGVLSADLVRRYDERVAELVEPDLASWVHHGRG
jgi:hypothetical protein